MLQKINAGKSMYIPGDDVDLVAALPLGVEALHAQLSVVQPILADSVPYLNERREETLNEYPCIKCNSIICSLKLAVIFI